MKATKKKITKKSKKSKGLGDSVEKVLKATKIDKVAKFLLGEDCGCAERKEKLNKIFRYRKPNCLSENEYKHLTDFFKVNRNTISAEQQKELLVIYNRVFNEKKKGSSCAPCVKAMVNELKALYKEYSDN